MENRVLKTLEFDKILKLLINDTQSEIGKEFLEKSQISSNIEEINKLLSQSDEAYRYILKKNLPLISNIYNIDNDIKIIKLGGYLIPKKLLEIKKILNTSRYLKNLFSVEEQEEYININSIINHLYTNINLENDIDRSILSENEIADDASYELKKIRKSIKQKNDLIRDKLNILISKSEKLMDNIYTMRDGRYVVPVKSEFKNTFGGIVHDRSSSGQTVYIEPSFIVELNNDLKKLEIDEEKEIEKILISFSTRILDIIDPLVDTIKKISEIDFIFAKGNLAVKMNAIRPNLNNKGIINLRSARHPLIDDEVVVPIDIKIGDEFNTLVITGPNTGGKTVTLKTVGLLTLMTQFGMLIPCSENSSIAVFESIYADIGDEQCIEQSLSTFSSHMQNIIKIIKLANDKSLILFDELGSGTDPEEGSGLSIAILNYFLEKNIRTIATTHYSKLKMYAMSTKNVQNAAVEFDVEKLAPTYKLIVGITGKSNAFEISKKLGLDNRFIEDAKRYLSTDNISFDKIVSEVEQKRKEYEKLISINEELLNNNRKLKEEYYKKIEKFNAQKEKKVKKLNKYIEDQITETNKFYKETIKQINKAKSIHDSKKLKHIQDKILVETKKINKNKIPQKVNVDRLTLNTPLILGEEVKILSLNENGYIQTLPDKNGNLQIKVGILKVNSNINDIIRIENVIDNTNKNNIVKTTNFVKENKSYTNRIDVRGLTSDEAIFLIDKFLDDAFIAKLNEVTIIHGKGTGKLRTSVADFLKKHKLVGNYSFGGYNEGGDGVTIVTFK